MENKKRKLALGICPKCGGRLVKRVESGVVYYGCTNFPKCTFTIDKIDDCA